MRAVTDSDLAAQAVEALRRSEHNFRTIIERSPLPTCVSSTTKLLYTNQAMLDYLGYTGDARILGPSLAGVGHIDELGVVVTHLGDDGIAAGRPGGGFNPAVRVGQRDPRLQLGAHG